MFAQQGQDEDRAVARALTTHHSRATARALRPIRAVLAATAVAATALVALTATTAGTAASAATVQPPKVLTGLTWHPLTLINGWQSEQGTDNSGDPSWAVKNGIVYLSGSMHQPGGGVNNEPAMLPVAARPAHKQYIAVYTQGGVTGTLEIWPTGQMYIGTSNAQAYTSLAGLSFPAATTAVHTLGLLNGWTPGTLSNGDPAYTVTGGVVHLTGAVHQPISGTNDEFAVLPATARPAHTLYLNVSTLANTTGVLKIFPDGVMQAYQGYAQGLTSLGGVSFPAATTATQPLSLLNGWQSSQSAYGTGDPAYTVTGAVVYLSGSMKQPSSGSTEFAVLPAVARPTHNLWITTYTYNGAAGALEIMPSGVMTAFNYTCSAAQSYTSLAAISYPVGS